MTMRVLLAALFVIAATPLAAAQFATPEELVEEMFDALNNGNVQRAARTMHPEALADLKRFFVEVEEMFPEEPFDGLPEGASFSAMSPEEIYEWLLLTALYAEMQEEGMTFSISYEYLDHEEDGDLLQARVLTHTAIDDFKMSETQTITMKQHEGGWLAMLSGDIEAYIEMMRAFMVDQ